MGIMDLSGKLLVPCKYNDIEQINLDVFKMEKFWSDRYYIVSKNIVACYYDGVRYGVFSNGAFRLYLMADDQLLFEGFLKKHDDFCLYEGNYIVTRGGDLFSLKANKVVYENIDDEEWHASSDAFCVVKPGYVEIYDDKGGLLRSIDDENMYQNVRIWNNGYITFNDASGQCCYYDTEWNSHKITNEAIKPDGKSLSIKSVVSENNFIIKGIGHFIVNNNGGIIAESGILEPIDDDHYYGSFYGTNEPLNDGNDWGIFNMIIGRVMVWGEYGNVYLIH